MNFARLYFNRLNEWIPPMDTVVVIDVLRSFTTAAVALAHGAEAIYPVANSGAARRLGEEVGNALLVGAMGGGKPVPGFDFGNSPSLLASDQVRRKNLVLSTAAGVRALQRFRAAPRLFAASLVCARATAQAIRASGANDICMIVTGEWVDRDGDEDIACADYIEALLRGEEVEAESYVRRVRDSSFGRRFGDSGAPHLPQADLDLAAQADRYPFAMPVRCEGDQLVIRPERC